MSDSHPAVRKKALEIYALAACLGALGFLAIDLGIGIYHLMGLVSAEMTVSSWEIAEHESDEAFKQHLCRQRRGEEPLPADSAIPAMRTESWARTLRRDRHEHLHRLVQAGIGVLVASGVFAIHWRVSRRARLGIPA